MILHHRVCHFGQSGNHRLASGNVRWWKDSIHTYFLLQRLLNRFPDKLSPTAPRLFSRFAWNCSTASILPDRVQRALLWVLTVLRPLSSHVGGSVACLPVFEHSTFRFPFLDFVAACWFAIGILLSVYVKFVWYYPPDEFRFAYYNSVSLKNIWEPQCANQSVWDPVWHKVRQHRWIFFFLTRLGAGVLRTWFFARRFSRKKFSARRWVRMSGILTCRLPL